MSLKKLFSVFFVLLGVAFLVFFIWSQYVARADPTLVAKVRTSGAVAMTETDHSITLRPTGYRTGNGLVFVPGGRVAPQAYVYKLSGLAESLGMTVVITKPYFNLAVLDIRPLSSFIYDQGGIDHWYVGGHSLGGVKACDYARDTRNEVKGIVLFAAYCTADVSVSALSLRGQHDKLVSEDDMRAQTTHLVGGDDYYEVEGANHASFGDYGAQDGDGTSEISSEDMRDSITSYLAAWPALAQ